MAVQTQDERIATLLASIEARVVSLESAAGQEEDAAGQEEIGAGVFNAEQIAEFKTVFDSVDVDSSGAIESGEMSELLKLLGQKTTEEELQKIMDDVDANSDGVIDFPEFLGMMARLTDGVTETSPVKLKKLSHYGRDTLLRWIKDDPEELDGDVTGPGIAPFRAAARRILLHRKPEWSMYVIITLAAIVSGVQTYPRFHDSIAIVIFEHSILVAFTLEIIVKMAGESSGKLYHFFQDGWNVFDFVIVAMLLIMIPFNGADFEGVRLLRLFRAFRLLKATRLLPKLGLVVETIITSASSVVYITLFLMLVAYIYAIIAVSTFRDNDPFHFDNLGIAMLSLFRIATMDDWTDVMYFNMFGCEWGDYGGATGGASCESEKFGLVAAIFFVSFIMMSAFLLLNLFIGVITASMEDAKEEMYRRKKENARLALSLRLRGKAKRKEKVASAGDTDGDAAAAMVE